METWLKPGLWVECWTYLGFTGIPGKFLDIYGINGNAWKRVTLYKKNVKISSTGVSDIIVKIGS
jgi:hypothetical protein